ncbi:MAG: hypothetical protein N4A57_07975 [Anaeromicrobium sp.]|uniref:hypothetical protein n=1 Tax=Anaeromicrobium sp. TaxID=1929132 RepID=UPI0025D44D98|nr:hypothetical protein [Anaeromicrobium sp.]MCT4594188.1 hypothetical protein [Anaeromicrobium sp.]
MKKLTLFIVTILIFTIITGVGVQAQENNTYKGYTFTEEVSEANRAKMISIVDQIIHKEAELKILEERAKKLQLEADECESKGYFDEMNDLYNKLSDIRSNKIFPLRWQIENLTNTDDDLFIRYIKNIDVGIENKEILQEVKKIKEKEYIQQEENKRAAQNIISKEVNLEPVSDKRRTYMINSIHFQSAKPIPAEAFTDEVIEGFSKINELQQQVDIIANEIEPEEFFKDERIQELLGQIKYIRETHLKEFMQKYNNTNYKIWEIDNIIASLSE